MVKEVALSIRGNVLDQRIYEVGEQAGAFGRDIMLLAIQLGGLFAINAAGYALVHVLHAPIPGNAVGLALLFTLLATNVVKVEWFDRAGSLLVKHMAFFFIPIAVGLMQFGGLLLSSGAALIAALILSAALGIVLAGTFTQRFCCPLCAELDELD